MGYAEEYPLSRFFVDARVLSIFEGADETLALKVIARRAWPKGLLAAGKSCRLTAQPQPADDTPEGRPAQPVFSRDVSRLRPGRSRSASGPVIAACRSGTSYSAACRRSCRYRLPRIDAEHRILHHRDSSCAFAAAAPRARSRAISNRCTSAVPSTTWSIFASAMNRASG